MILRDTVYVSRKDVVGSGLGLTTDDLRKAVASFANEAEGGGPPPAGS